MDQGIRNSVQDLLFEVRTGRTSYNAAKFTVGKWLSQKMLNIDEATLLLEKMEHGQPQPGIPIHLDGKLYCYMRYNPVRETVPEFRWPNEIQWIDAVKSLRKQRVPHKHRQAIELGIRTLANKS